MSGNVMKKVELNYEKESMIYRYLDSFANFIKTDSKEDKEKLARETVEVMELVATQNAIKAEEVEKKIKAEVLDELRKEIVTKDYVDNKITRAKYSILILVGIILASVISAGYVYVNDVKTELKEDIRKIEETNQRILDILISQSKKD